MRVGYYVNNEYTDASMNEEPPAKPEIEKIRRNILADKPRVTRFQIKWDSEESAPSEFPPEQPDVDNQEDDEAAYGAEDDAEEEEEGTAAGALVEGGEALATAKVPGEDADADMEGADNGKEDDEESNAGSEVDLEAESEDDEDDEEEAEEEGEADADDMEMDDAPPDAGHGKMAGAQQPHHQAEMMVH